MIPTSNSEFEEALRAYFVPIRAFCERMLGERHAAEDAAQQTFLQALRAWKRFEHRSHRKTWLFRIAANVCARALERSRRAAEDASSIDSQEPTDDNSPARPLERAEEAAAVHAALMALSPAHRMVLVLFCVEDLTHAEIAELLGCPGGTIWSRLHHARKAFAERLQGLGVREVPELKA